MFDEFEFNKHPKYGTAIKKSRRSNGWLRSKNRQHKLERGLANTSNLIWATGVFFDEDKERLIWFNNLWHRKFWRENFNRRIRRMKNIYDNNFYRKLFFLALNCDMVKVTYHGIKKSRREWKEKIVNTKYHARQVRASRLQWTPIYGRI